MILWRFSQHASLDGRGGLFASGRWHSRGQEILYCAPNPATALLEVMVHGAVRSAAAFGNFHFLKIELPDTVSMERVGEAQLHRDWIMRLEITRARGDRWLREHKAAMLFVPSVLVPETDNALVNPHHPAAAQLRLVSEVSFPLDARMFATGSK